MLPATMLPATMIPAVGTRRLAMLRWMIPLSVLVMAAAASARDARVCDFDGDRRGDLHSESGNDYLDRIRIWGGSEVLATTYLRRGVGLSVACGDVDGDGKADLVQDLGSAIRINYMDGATVREQRYLPNGGGIYGIQFVSDLDADGRAELLEYEFVPAPPAPGANRIVKLDAAQGVESLHEIDNQRQNWGLRAVADLDGDGRKDLVWLHHPTRAVRIDLDPLGVGESVFLSTGASTLFGAADVDGDGRADLISDGPDFIRIDRMDGGTILETGFLAGQLEGLAPLGARRVGDLDGDGRADVIASPMQTLYRPLVRIDLMNGVTSFARGVLATGETGGFELADVADMTGDGKADLVFEGFGWIRIDVMNGLNRTESAWVPDHW